MTRGHDFTLPLNPNFIVAAAVYDAFPDGDIVLRPESVAGLTDTFTVIHVGHVADGIQYFVGLYGEHNLEDMPVNPMNLEVLVIGVRLVDDRMTIAEALSVNASTNALLAANMLMLAQYGVELSTDQQLVDASSDVWTLTLTEYRDPVTCKRMAAIEIDGADYLFYVGMGKVDEKPEHFLLVVELIGGEFFHVDTDDHCLWPILRSAFLEKFDIEIDDESDDGESLDEVDPEGSEGDPEPDTSVC